MKLVASLIFILSTSILCQGQNFPAKEFKEGKVTWLGLDFTLCKLVDQFAFTNAEHLATSYIPAWNNFVSNEPTKYDIGKYFSKPSVIINLDFTDKYNTTINPDSLVQNKFYTLDSELVRSDAKKYQTSGLEGIGILMYVESFNKNVSSGSYWLTLIDLKTGNTLFMDKVSGAPGGFGVRNYWIATFLGSLKDIDKKMAKWLK